MKIRYKKRMSTRKVYKSKKSVRKLKKQKKRTKATTVVSLAITGNQKKIPEPPV